MCVPHYLKIPPIALDASTESTAIHQISSKPTVPQSPVMHTHMQSEQLRASIATHSLRKPEHPRLFSDVLVPTGFKKYQYECLD